MSDKEEDRTFQLECIAVYQSLSALWKVKCDDYSNRQQQQKDAAYAVLVEKFQEEYQNYTREDVKRKINSYRTTVARKHGLTYICSLFSNKGLNHLQMLIVGLNTHAQKVFKITWLILAQST